VADSARVLAGGSELQVALSTAKAAVDEVTLEPGVDG